jgi:hypothetical protein
MQGNKDKETSTDEVQSTREYKKISVGAGFFAPIQAGRGAHPGSSTISTGSLSRG